jgi:hypothetical protein
MFGIGSFHTIVDCKIIVDVFEVGFEVVDN